MQNTRHTAELRETLGRYLGAYPEEENRLARLVEQLENSLAHPCDRCTIPGHVTASGIVTDREKVLMIFHPVLNKWLQPGGHIDAGETPTAAAIRETCEETGFSAQLHPWHESRPYPVDIDIHSIPPNPTKAESEHLHYDFRYRLHISGQHTIQADYLVVSWRAWATVDEPQLQTLRRKLASA